MTKKEILNALDEGKKVYWKNQNYELKKKRYPSGSTKYIVTSQATMFCIGLYSDNGEWNVNSEECFIKEGVL